jgi:ferredoxin
MNDWTLPIIDHQICTNCGSCAAACPEHALEMVDGEIAFTQPQACTFCTQCESICPESAITCGFTISWEND